MGKEINFSKRELEITLGGENSGGMIKKVFIPTIGGGGGERGCSGEMPLGSQKRRIWQYSFKGLENQGGKKGSVRKKGVGRRIDVWGKKREKATYVGQKVGDKNSFVHRNIHEVGRKVIKKKRKPQHGTVDCRGGRS